MSCVQIILEDGALHWVKSIDSRPMLFSKAISIKCFSGGFLKGPVVSEIGVPNHVKNPLG
jgi:hypothetical protein